METDGGGWTFIGHVNNNYDNGQSFFTDVIGSYDVSRIDDDTTYSNGLMDELFDTEIMGVLDNVDPLVADSQNKIVFYKYDVNHPAFNSGPIPCNGLDQTFDYKTQINENYILDGKTNNCQSGRWYPRDNLNAQYLVLFRTGTFGSYWGVGIGGDDSWGHDGWFYVR
jgi:hypothetical protein